MATLLEGPVVETRAYMTCFFRVRGYPLCYEKFAMIFLMSRFGRRSHGIFKFSFHIIFCLFSDKTIYIVSDTPNVPQIDLRYRTSMKIVT